MVSDCAGAASGLGRLFSVGLGSRGRVGLKNGYFRFGENFPSDFWGIVSEFCVGDWVLFSVRVKNHSLPVWGFSDAFRRLSEDFPKMFRICSEGVPKMFRRFPEGCPRGSGKGALIWGFRGKARWVLGRGAYLGLSGTTFVWLVEWKGAYSSPFRFRGLIDSLPVRSSVGCYCHFLCKFFSGSLIGPFVPRGTKCGSLIGQVPYSPRILLVMYEYLLHRLFQKRILLSDWKPSPLAF